MSFKGLAGQELQHSTVWEGDAYGASGHETIRTKKNNNKKIIRHLGQYAMSQLKDQLLRSCWACGDVSSDVP